MIGFHIVCMFNCIIFAEKYAIKLGYSEKEKEKLLDDIEGNTVIKTLTFSRLEEKCLKCEAKTILKGNIVTSIWELKENLEIRFITLIPGGEKRWK